MDDKTENRITIRWTGLVAHGLEDDLEGLLTLYGYRCVARGRDTGGDQERVLVFGPVEEEQ